MKIIVCLAITYMESHPLRNHTPFDLADPVIVAGSAALVSEIDGDAKRAEAKRADAKRADAKRDAGAKRISSDVTAARRPASWRAKLRAAADELKQIGTRIPHAPDTALTIAYIRLSDPNYKKDLEKSEKENA